MKNLNASHFGMINLKIQLKKLCRRRRVCLSFFMLMTSPRSIIPRREPKGKMTALSPLPRGWGWGCVCVCGGGGRDQISICVCVLFSPKRGGVLGAIILSIKSAGVAAPRAQESPGGAARHPKIPARALHDSCSLAS